MSSGLLCAGRFPTRMTGRSILRMACQSHGANVRYLSALLPYRVRGTQAGKTSTRTSNLFRTSKPAEYDALVWTAAAAAWPFGFAAEESGTGRAGRFAGDLGRDMSRGWSGR